MGRPDPAVGETLVGELKRLTQVHHHLLQLHVLVFLPEGYKEDDKVTPPTCWLGTQAAGTRLMEAQGSLSVQSDTACRTVWAHGALVKSESPPAPNVVLWSGPVLRMAN